MLVTFAVIAWDDVARAARLFNLLVGAWLLVAPWILEGTTRLSLANGMAVGLLLMALSVRRGRVTERFGAWDACVI